MSDVFNTKDLLNSLDKLSPEQKQLLLSRLVEEMNTVDEIDQNLGNNIIVCKSCGSISVKKHGKINNKQRYRCKDCGKTFQLESHTIFRYSHLDHTQWRTIAEGMVLNLSIPRIADMTGLSTYAVWYNEKKIMSLLMELFGQQDKFVDIAECDEKEVHLSYKGKRDAGFFVNTLGRMPRHHRSLEQKKLYLIKNGLMKDLEADPEKLNDLLFGDTYIRGTKNDSVCILSGKDRSGNLYVNATCVGKLESKHVEERFKDRFEPDAVLVTDSSPAYDWFAELENIHHVKIEPDKHNKGPYNLSRINSIHSNMDKYWPDSKQNLPATKYLDLGLMMFWWLEKHKDLSVQEQVNTLLGYIIDHEFRIKYEELRHRKLTLDTKGLIPEKL